MRRYRIDANGQEQPVWASKRRLSELGRAEGAAAFRDGREPSRWGNATMDDAARAEWERLKAEAL